MNKTRDLNGLRVLNTRPKGQELALSQAIHEAGGHAIHCPTMLILPIPEITWLPTLPPLLTVQYAIFTSVNAVHCFFDGLKNRDYPWADQITVIAIGKATAQALAEHHVSVHFVPKEADSEHLVKLPILAQIKNQTILLIKGEGGRSLISETLTARGGNLIILNVYRRSIPELSRDKLTRLWQNDTIDIIVFTSQEAMQNLFILLGPQAKTWLQHKSCLVISHRLSEKALTLGIKKVTICRPDTIIETLHQLNQGLIDE